MEIIIEELKIAIYNKLFFLAINISLTIPDICAALESENGQTSGTKYKNWVDTYLSPKYDGFISGDDIYKIRCASLHQGKFDHDNPRFEKIAFQIPEEGLFFHNNIFGKTLQLNAGTFIADVIESYNEWKIANSNNETVKTNALAGFRIYDEGYPGLANFGHFIG